LEEIASILGRDEFFLVEMTIVEWQSDWRTANRQSPILMDCEYRVTFTDHDWVVAVQHKLIPSVYAGIEII
jgi:hypothetical protein